MIGKRKFPKDDYLKFINFHYENREPFIIVNHFECIIKDGKHILFSCAL